MEGAVFEREGLESRYTRDDYGAIMNYARVSPPVPKTSYVDIAGGDSSIDLTEAVGGVVYEDANIDMKFTLLSGEKAEAMKNDLHGRKTKITLEREPEYYYDGRVSADKLERDGRVYELYLKARVRPYKLLREPCIHIEEIEGRDKEVLLENDVMPAMPEIRVEGEVLLDYEGSRYRMRTGKYQMPEITLHEGLNRMRLSGTGRVEFVYKKGRLA